MKMTEACCEEPAICEKEECQDIPTADSLPPGIKTEAVLMLLGNISNALNEIVNGINSTITQIVTDGQAEAKAQTEEGEMDNGEQDS